MPAEFRTELVGAKEAIRSLNKIEPGLRKQFAAEATAIAQPAIKEAQRRYGSIGWGESQVRGVSRNWSDKGRKLFPWNPNKAANSVKVKLEGDRRRTAVIVIEQRDAATAVLESAGRKNANPLGDALGFIKPSTSRVLGPALFSKRAEVTDQMERAMLDAISKVQRELN
jgi:hypothetical protein